MRGQDHTGQAESWKRHVRVGPRALRARRPDGPDVSRDRQLHVEQFWYFKFKFNLFYFNLISPLCLFNVIVIFTESFFTFFCCSFNTLSRDHNLKF